MHSFSATAVCMSHTPRTHFPGNEINKLIPQTSISSHQDNVFLQIRFRFINFPHVFLIF
jgi:hypothetical protein